MFETLLKREGGREGGRADIPVALCPVPVRPCWLHGLPSMVEVALGYVSQADFSSSHGTGWRGKKCGLDLPPAIASFMNPFTLGVFGRQMGWEPAETFPFVKR